MTRKADSQPTPGPNTLSILMSILGSRPSSRPEHSVARTPLTPLKSLLHTNSGASAIEFALSAPLLLGLLVPVADLGIAFSQKHQVQQAVQAGAQYAATHPWHSGSVAAITTAVQAASQLSGIAVTPAPYQACGCPSDTTVTMATCGSTCPNSEVAGYYVVVSAQLAYRPRLPYSALGESTTLNAQSTVRIR